MIEVRCTCGHSFDVDDVALGITAECPRCGEVVLVPGKDEAIIELNPLDEAPREVTLIGRPVEPPPPGEGDDDEQQFSFETRLADLLDAIAQPKVPFGQDVARSFAVLFTGRNRLMLPAILLVDLLVLGAVSLALFHFNILFIVAALALGFTPFAWHCAVFFRACEHACAGQDDEHLTGIDHGVWEDLFRPFGRFLATWWLALMPLWGYMILRILAPALPAGPDAVLTLLAVCLFLWPGTVLLMVLADSITELTPANLFRIVFGAPGAYIAVWFALACIAGLAVLAGWVGRQALREAGAAWAGVYLIILLCSITGLHQKPSAIATDGFRDPADA